MENYRDVFISYHTTTAKDVVEAIGNRFESDGISCWYAPRDCEDNYDEAIMQAIGKAKLFLFICNKGSNASEQVGNEIHEAFSRYTNNSMSIVIFQIDTAPVSDTVKYFFGRFHRVDGITPPMTDRINELYYRVKYHLENTTEIKSLTEESRIISEPVTPVLSFIGRKNELNEIDFLMKNNRPLFICGMGGIGKSELIRQYISLHQNEYRTIAWASYSSSLRQLILDDQMIRISNFFRNPINESDESYFNRKVEFYKSKCTKEDLLIIDNFNTIDDPDLDLIMSFPCSIIFTTRINFPKEEYVAIHISEMENENDLLSLFKLGYPRTLDDENKKKVLEIIERLSGHTLSIKIVSRLMASQRIKPLAMLEKLNKEMFNALNDYQDKQHRYDYQITNLFQLAKLTEEEKNILENMVFIPLEGISVEDFYEESGLKSFDDIDALTTKNWIKYDVASDVISLHPIIADMVGSRASFESEINLNFLNKVISELSKMFSMEPVKRDWYLQLADRIVKYLPNTNSLYTKFYYTLGGAYHALSRHLRTIEVLSYFVDHTADYTARARTAVDVADAYRCLNDKENLAIWCEKADLCIKEAPLNKEVLIAEADLLGRYGFYYNMTKEFDKALASFKKQLEKTIALKGEMDASTGWAYYNIATSYEKTGDFEECLAYYLKAKEIFIFIDSKYAIANIYKAIGCMQYFEKKYEDSILNASEGLDLLKEAQGEIHTDVAFCYGLLARDYEMLGNDTLAKEYKDKAIQILTKLGYPDLYYRWKMVVEE